MKEYCKVIFETDATDYICLWCCDINSSFVTEEDHVLCFRDEDVFDSYCRAKGLSVPDTQVYDLAELMTFAQGATDDFHAGTLLNFWNIVADLAFTLKLDFLGDDDNDALSELYDTLFFIDTADAEEDTKKELTASDLDDLREVVGDGCRLIVTHLTAL